MLSIMRHPIIQYLWCSRHPTVTGSACDAEDHNNVNNASRSAGTCQWGRTVKFKKKLSTMQQQEADVSCILLPTLELFDDEVQHFWHSSCYTATPEAITIEISRVSRLNPVNETAVVVDLESCGQCRLKGQHFDDHFRDTLFCSWPLFSCSVNFTGALTKVFSLLTTP